VARGLQTAGRLALRILLGAGLGLGSRVLSVGVQAEPKVAVDLAAISVSRDITFLQAARQLNLVVRWQRRRVNEVGTMNYWSNLFTPETFEAFARSVRTISGFRESQRAMAEKVRVDDKFICYMVRMSRYVLDGPFTDNTPIFVPDDDPFVVRFKVRSAVWLPLEKTIPIHEPEVYSHLTFTRDVKPGGYWLGPLRRSLVKLNQDDGTFLDELLQRLQGEARTFPVDSEQYDRALKRRIQRPDRSVVVSVPDDRMARRPVIASVRP
jgi:hypothetical protein